MSPFKKVTSAWSSKIYPCSKRCGFYGALDAFKNGQCYDPCPCCGAKREQRTGRYVYALIPAKWLPFIKRKLFVGVEWQDEHCNNPKA